MNRMFSLAAALSCAALLSACMVMPHQHGGVTAPGAYAPQRFVAVGYGAMGGNYSQYTPAQQKLMAMRAARVDAYRALAEQVYGFRVSGSTSVSGFATQSDNIRTYVDAVIRGARLVSINPIADGNFEATVELDVPATFFSCLNNVQFGPHCPLPAYTHAHNDWCSAPGCVQPSVYYYTAP